MIKNEWADSCGSSPRQKPCAPEICIGVIEGKLLSSHVMQKALILYLWSKEVLPKLPKNPAEIDIAQTKHVWVGELAFP